MEDYQKRVLEEQADLEGKIQRLDAFMVSPAYSSIPAGDAHMLNKQYAAMRKYKDVLAERIARFPAA